MYPAENATTMEKREQCARKPTVSATVLIRSFFSAKTNNQSQNKPHKPKTVQAASNDPFISNNP